MRKKKKSKANQRICGWLSAAGLFVTYGSIGGMEGGSMSLLGGTLYAVVGLIVFTVAAYEGGFMYHR